MEFHAVDLLIHIINIGVLYLVLSRLVYRPVKKFMDEREAKLQARVDEVTQREVEAAEMQHRYEEKIHTVEEQAKELIRSATEQGNIESERIVREARARASQLVKEGESRAQAAYDRQVAESQDEILEFSMNIAEQVLGREVTAEDNAALVDYYFKKKE